MGMTADEFDELQAAVALGATDRATRETVEDAARTDATLRTRQDELRRTVGALDQLLETAPPQRVRGRLLAAAGQRPPSLAPPSDVPNLFAHQVEDLAELLAGLGDADWVQPVGPYPWSVHGLVAHLLVIESYTAGQLGLIDGHPTRGHHLEIGSEIIAAELTQNPSSTASRWLERAAGTSRALSDPEVDLPSDVMLHGWPFSLEGALIARSFEIWTHADDIRRAIGVPVRTPTPGDVRTMSDFSVRSLPLTLGLVARDMPLTPTRIVLTGAGGATFDIGDVDGPPTTVVADVVDYCRLVARRIDPVDLECVITGDVSLGRSLLAGASVFAV